MKCWKSSAAVLAKGEGKGELIRPGWNAVMSERFYSRDKISRGEARKRKMHRKRRKRRRGVRGAANSPVIRELQLHRGGHRAGNREGCCR